MLFSTTLLVVGSVAHEAAAFLDVPPTVAPTLISPEQRNGLLATLISREDSACQLAYAALVAHALICDDHGRPTQVDLLQPLLELSPTEQHAVRTWLVGHSWPAWARAPQPLRALLGCPEPPLLLADAARQTGAVLGTLANAAVRGRLPTQRVGDRHLVYLETIDEAYARGVLHVERGRPRPGRR